MTLLFSGADINVAFKNVQGNAEVEIGNFSDDYVLARSVEDLTESVYEKYAVKTPVLNKNAIGSDWVDGYVPEYRTPNPNFDQQPGMKGRIYSLHVPYTGDEYLFHYMPMTPPPNPVHATVSKTEIVFAAAGGWHTSKSINKQFDDNLATLEDGIQRVEKSVTPFNAYLRNVIIAQLAHRVNSARKTRQTTEGLKYPLRRRDDAPQTFKLPEKAKKLVLQNQSSEQPTSPSLDCGRGLPEHPQDLCEYVAGDGAQPVGFRGRRRGGHQGPLPCSAKRPIQR